jgi:hypothetical protein
LAKRTRRVTVETHSLTVLRTLGQTSSLWCKACGAETLAVTIDVAAGIGSVTQREIFRLIETGLLHFTEMPSGSLLICVESLRSRAEEDSK